MSVVVGISAFLAPEANKRILQADHPSRTLLSFRLVNLKFVAAPLQISNISVFVVAFYRLFPSQNVYYFPSYILPSVAAATRPLHLTYKFELFLTNV